MKKLVFAFTVLATVTLASCGSNASNETKAEETTSTECTTETTEACTNDSTSTECCANDSAAVETPAAAEEVAE